MSRYSRRPIVVAVAAGVLILSANFVSSSASADPLPVESGDAMAQQERNDEFLSWLAESEFVDRGLVVPVYNEADHSLTLRWKGLKSEDREQVQTRAKLLNVDVNFAVAKYSLSELFDAQRGISSEADRLATSGFTLDSISGVADLDNGITVTGLLDSPKDKAKVVADVARIAQAVTEIPVRVEIVEKPLFEPAAATRSNDVETFNAGGYMLDKKTGGLCSTAFGITINGTKRTTTARHCNGADYKARNNSSTDYGTTSTHSGDGAARVLSKGGSLLDVYRRLEQFR